MTDETDALPLLRAGPIPSVITGHDRSGTITIKEAAPWLSEDAIESARRRGYLFGVHKAGGRWRVPVLALDLYLAVRRPAQRPLAVDDKDKAKDALTAWLAEEDAPGRPSNAGGLSWALTQQNSLRADRYGEESWQIVLDNVPSIRREERERERTGRQSAEFDPVSLEAHSKKHHKEHDGDDVDDQADTGYKPVQKRANRLNGCHAGDRGAGPEVLSRATVKRLKRERPEEHLARAEWLASPPC